MKNETPLIQANFGFQIGKQIAKGKGNCCIPTLLVSDC